MLCHHKFSDLSHIFKILQFFIFFKVWFIALNRKYGWVQIPRSGLYVSVFQLHSHLEHLDLLLRQGQEEEVRMISDSYFSSSQGEHPGGGRWQVHRGPRARPSECGDVPGPAGFLLSRSLHLQRSVSPSYCLLVNSTTAGKKGFPCFKLDEDNLERCMGPGKGRDHPELRPETLNFLRQMYRPMLAQFYNETGTRIRLS